MSDVKQLRAENRQLRRDAREAMIRAAAYKRVVEEVLERRRAVSNWCAGKDLDQAVQHQKFYAETYIGKAARSAFDRRGLDMVEKALCDPQGDILTLEDLQDVRRDDVAGLKGVGPGTMACLDEALEQRELGWADPDDGSAPGPLTLKRAGAAA
jgi:hypothetical protein